MNLTEFKINIGKITDNGNFIKFVDNSYVGVISNNKQIKIFDIYSGECTKLFEESEKEFTCFEVFNNNYLITSEYFYSDSHKVSLWNLNEGKIFKSRRSKDFGYSEATGIVSDNFGNFIISYSGKTLLINSSFEIVSSLNISWSCSLDVDRHGKRVVTGDHDGYIKIGNLKNEQITRNYRAFDLTYCEPAEFQYMKCYFNFFNDNEIFVTSQIKDKVFIYEIEETKLNETNMSHNEAILLSNISPDKTKLLTMSFQIEQTIKEEQNNYPYYLGNFIIKIWDLKYQKLETEIKKSSRMGHLDDFYNQFDICSISLNFENSKLALLSKTEGILIYNIETKSEIISIKPQIEKFSYPLSISKNNNILTYLNSESFKMNIFSLNENKLLKEFPLRDNSFIQNNEKALVNTIPGYLTLINLETGEEISSFLIDEGNKIIKWDLNDNFIVLISIYQEHYTYNYIVKSNVKLIDVNTGTIIKEIEFDFFIEKIKLLKNKGKLVLFFINHVTVGTMMGKSVGTSIMVFDFETKSFIDDLEYFESDNNLKISKTSDENISVTEKDIIFSCNPKENGKINHQINEIIFWNIYSKKIDKRIKSNLEIENYNFDENNQILFIKGRKTINDEGFADDYQFIEIWDTKNDELIKNIKIDNQFSFYSNYMIYHNENILLILNNDASLKFFDIKKMCDLGDYYKLIDNKGFFWLINEKMGNISTNRIDLVSVEQLNSYKIIEDNDLKSKYLFEVNNEKFIKENIIN